MSVALHCGFDLYSSALLLCLVAFVKDRVSGLEGTSLFLVQHGHFIHEETGSEETGDLFTISQGQA
jgi:hypothetical protein